VAVTLAALSRPLRLVRVQCPSTGRQYALPVPPTIQTCQQAVAWGFAEKAIKFAAER